MNKCHSIAPSLCRHWREVLSTPKYWRWGTVRLTSQTCQQILHSDLLTRMTSVQLDSLPPGLLQTVLTWLAEAEDSPVKCVSVSGDLTSLTPDTLALAAVRLEMISLDRVTASTPQLESLCSQIVDTAKVRLRTLSVEWSPSLLTTTSPERLGQALVRLEEVNMWGQSLTAEQLSHIFTSISERPDLRLRSLNLTGTDLSSLPPALLARSVTRLEQLLLLNTRLTSLQLELLLTEIVQTSPLSLSRLYLREAAEKNIVNLI